MCSVTTQSNHIVMGNNSVTNAVVKVAWTIASDARSKTCVIPIPVGTDLFRQLKPVQYNWMDRVTGCVTDPQPRYGFLAQDILAIEGSPSILVDDTDPEMLKLRESMLVPVLVKAVQDLIAQVDASANEIKELRTEVDALKNQ